VQLDADLMRELLLHIEQAYPRVGKLVYPIISGYTEEQVAYHCLMAYEAGFIDALDASSFDRPFPEMYPKRLTYAGHQYVEKVRDPVIWTKTKEGAKKIGSFSIETLGKLATGFIETQVRKHTGLDIAD
jgi:hypothetical protein